MSICLQEDSHSQLNFSNTTALEVKSLQVVNSMLLLTVPSVYLTVGTVGNLVNLAVLSRKAFSNKVTCTAITLRFLASVDLVVLWTSLSRLLLMGIYDVDFRGNSMNLCRIHKFWHFFCMSTTNWTLVLLALTRYVRMAHPFRVHILFTQCRIYMALTVILVLAATSSLLYYKNYVGTGPVHNNCDICVLAPISSTVLFKVVQLLPVYIVPGCLLVFFHWRIIVNYQIMLNRRDRLRTQFREIVHRIRNLRQQIDNIEKGEDTEQRMEIATPRLSIQECHSAIYSIHHDEHENRKLTSAMKQIRKPSSPNDPVKKIRFSHVVDLETSKIDNLSRCSSVTVGSCTSVDPFLDAESHEVKKILLIKEERNMRRIRTAYGILWLAAQSDDFVIWEISDGSQRQRNYMLSGVGSRLSSRWYVPKSPTLHVVVAFATFVFLLFNIPFCVWYSVSHLFPSSTVLETARKNMTWTLVLLMTYFCSTFNFMFYSTLSSKFQAELCSCLLCYHDNWLARLSTSSNEGPNIYRKHNADSIG